MKEKIKLLKERKERYQLSKMSKRAKEILDVYICPKQCELSYRNTAFHHGRMMRIYKSKCTRNQKGRIIYLWEHESIIEEMRERVRREKEKVKMRQSLVLAYNIKRVLNLKFYYFLEKVINFILYWLNPVQKGVIYV